MGNPRGAKRDFDALEQRRFQAIELLKQGFNQSETARRVKVCSQTVSRWAAQLAQGGERALQKAGRAGRKPLLRRVHKQRLEQLLVQGPERLGYETPLWTSPRVAHLIEDEFGIRYHAGHCLEDPARAGLELPAAGEPRARAQRRSDLPLEESAVAGN
jgi:transposase